VVVGTVLAVTWYVSGTGGAEVDGVPVAASPAAALVSGLVEQAQGLGPGPASP
jgi:hypothetical protein